MYFPYLYGKQKELIAVRLLSNRLAIEASVQPVLEPVRTDAATLKITLKLCEKSKLNTWLVLNPQLSRFRGHEPDAALAWDVETMGALATREYIRPTLMLSERLQLSTVKAFNDRFKGESVGLVVIPESKDIEKSLSALKSVKLDRVFFKGPHPSMANVALAGKHRSVWVEDRFPYRSRNADYEGSHFFTDRHATFFTSGWGGFSDYALMAPVPRDGGGPPGAVAFHLSYFDKSNPQKHVHVEHFVSDRQEQSDNDTDGKFLEALGKFQRASKRTGSSFGLTGAASEYLARHKSSTPPDLATNKQLGVMHHLDLMSGLLAGRF
ncbi:sce7725 family protein [Calothrix sp. FACHB-1219]|uniref:sce7725 family protein n=1 Tax=Calothrix sp. FACHB-1219 TaxID=2692778 RepID=UPI001685A9AB|nr:sce7725 family protein [Calothrix sp. FACHB-1219]MBD2222871.1 sce7725 family protein [Calothrix sp. FACHB-1219]